MKKWIAAILAVLLLTGCQAQPTEQPEVPADPEPVVTQPVEEDTPVEEPPETVEIPVETVEQEPYYTEMNLDVAYDIQTVEGLVEDSIGYVYEYPVFSGLDGAEEINTYYEEMMVFLESYARETVYPQAADRHTIANVYGTFEIVAADEGLQLGVKYTVSVEFADAEEPESFDRTDVFHPDTGLLLGSN